MKENENNNSINNKLPKDENNDDLLQIDDNLNINQIVDIKEKPKKYIVNTKKKYISNNSLDDNYIDSENILPIKQNKKNISKANITYEDIYLGNEMLVARPKSNPKDLSKNNKYLKQFSKMYNKTYSSGSHNSSMSNKSNKSNNSNNSNSNSNNISSSTNNISNISLGEGEEEEYNDEEPILIRNNSCDIFRKTEESTHLKDF